MISYAYYKINISMIAIIYTFLCTFLYFFKNLKDLNVISNATNRESQFFILFSYNS